MRIPDDEVPITGAAAGDEADAEHGRESLFDYLPTTEPRAHSVSAFDAPNELPHDGAEAAPAEPAEPAPTPNEETPTAPVQSPPAPTATQRASHIRTAPIVDDRAIVMMRPIDIVSDMPAMPPSSSPESGGDGDGDDGLEEIEPERMSLPGSVISNELRSDAKPPPLTHVRGPLSGPASDIPGRTMPPPPPSNPAGAKPAPIPQGPVSAPPKSIEAPKAAAATTEASPPTKAKRPWWSEMFEDDMARTLDNPRQRDVERESNFIDQSFGLPPGSRILDLACGHGVHAVELASRGYQLVAVDLSTTLLGLARAYNERQGQNVSFVQGDMRQIELDGVFDGIYCWGSSFGYFDDPTNLNVLERIARALKPGGKLLLDLTNRDFIAPRSPSTAWFDKPGCVCMDEIRFDFFTSRLHAKRMVIFESGRGREVDYSLRLYTAHELGMMLQQLGLRVIEASGHRAHRGAYFGSESPRLILLAEKG